MTDVRRERRFDRRRRAAKAGVCPPTAAKPSTRRCTGTTTTSTTAHLHYQLYAIVNYASRVDGVLVARACWPPVAPGRRLH